MAAVFKYDEKDIPQFQKDMCPKCVLKGRCIEEGKDNHWFLTCPHYHQWKLGYTSFVFELMEYQREHPEETEALHQEQIKKAKAVREQMEKEGKIKPRKTKKKEEK